jgi:DNA-binding MarR family transcriptional regulator
MNLIVQKLEARGLVGRSPATTHGKILSTEVTSQGEGLLDQANALVLDVQNEIFGRISEEEARALTHILRKLKRG